MKTIWVIVTDGGRALFYANAGGKLAPRLELVKELGLDNPPSRDQGADRPGRSNTPAGKRSAVEETDRHKLAERRFAGQVAEEVNGAALTNLFDQLIVYADSSTLGELRKHFNKQAQQKILHAEALDLVKHPVQDIELRLKQVFLPDG